MEIVKDNVLGVEVPDIKSNLIGKKVKIKGMVSKSTDILNERCYTIYKCSKCGLERKVTSGKKPWICYNKNCGASGSYRKIDEQFRDFRDIEIEETLENVNRQPGRIKVRLLGDILDRVDIKNIQIGQLVEIIGVVNKEKIKTKNDREIFGYYLVCSTIEILDYSGDISEITEEDEIEIERIAKNNPLETLRGALAPNLIGLDSIKKSIILQLVRGPDNLKNVRPRIHILVIGSPSVGKSQLGWETHLKTPKSMYGSGDNMSAAGLSASVEKDEFSGRWMARGGLLSRANGSLVIIDEVEKLKNDDKKALHTPMEQGIIVVDKAGVHIQMLADCSILALCNPKKGFFDTSGYRSVSEEVKLPEPLISRFDLIFYVKDEIDKKKDKLIIENLFVEKDKVDRISSDIFKKYIKKASKIKPIITREVRATLEDIYLKLRNSSKNSLENITPRQAGGLLRLAVASAKIRLSEKVELQDLEIAESLMLDALESIGFERNLNSLDQASIYTNTTRKKISVQNQIIELIKDLIKSGKRTENELEETVLLRGFSLELFRKTFEGLSRDGSIIKQSGGLRWIE